MLHLKKTNPGAQFKSSRVIVMIDLLHIPLHIKLNSITMHAHPRHQLTLVT